MNEALKMSISFYNDEEADALYVQGTTYLVKVGGALTVEVNDKGDAMLRFRNGFGTIPAADFANPEGGPAGLAKKAAEQGYSFAKGQELLVGWYIDEATEQGWRVKQGMPRHPKVTKDSFRIMTPMDADSLK